MDKTLYELQSVIEQLSVKVNSSIARAILMIVFMHQQVVDIVNKVNNKLQLKMFYQT